MIELSKLVSKFELTRLTLKVELSRHRLKVQINRSYLKVKTNQLKVKPSLWRWNLREPTRLNVKTSPYRSKVELTQLELKDMVLI